MLSVDEALAAVTAGVRPLPAQLVSIADALGRVLAADVAARRSQPPVAVSAMDGYAVRAEGAAVPPASFRLVGESAAGGGFAGTVGVGEAVRISTGAPLPEGADAIVPQEDVRRHGDRVEVAAAVTAGRWIRPEGLDFCKGDVLLPAGRLLTARDIGLAAAMNVPWLTVRRRPRVAVLATGNEVAMPGDPLGPVQIASSNSLALCAYVAALGGEPANLGIAADDAASLKTALEAAVGADLLVTVGGASVGDHDLVRTALTDRGFDVAFHRVAMRPGKPLLFGRLGPLAVLGLPGNPVSVGVTAVVFLRPLMLALLGLADDGPHRQARLGRALAANDERQDYLRADLVTAADGEAVATPFALQDSSMLTLLARADCLVVRPPHAPAAAAGDRVEILPLRYAAQTW
jgi:molybdopterin molybdotransferase